MKNLKGALLFAQSGGPTSVINASACGVFEEAFKHGEITQVLGAAHGVVGILNDELYDMGKEDPAEIHRLLGTPSSALGSCRYKLKDYRDDETDYLRILEVFKKHNVKYFFYNGGNDSMDTCNKIGEFVNAHGYECNVVGVPKTIDNDLYGIDHCPGYASAAKYIATTCMEIDLDARVFDKGMITIIEIMGRHAGWLTAASAVATYAGHGPDLIYVPETDFDLDKFTADVKAVFEKHGKCIVAVSEDRAVLDDACSEDGALIAVNEPFASYEGSGFDIAVSVLAISGLDTRELTPYLFALHDALLDGGSLYLSFPSTDKISPYPKKLVDAWYAMDEKIYMKRYVPEDVLMALSMIGFSIRAIEKDVNPDLGDITSIHAMKVTDR